MIPNFAPEFKFNDEVEILDELGGSTGKRGYVYAIYCKQDNDTPEYAIMLARPFSGSRHFPAALLRRVVTTSVVPQRKIVRKRRTHPADISTPEIIVLTGPPLPKQKASVATPRRHAPQVQPPEQEATRYEQHSTDRRPVSSRGAK